MRPAAVLPRRFGDVTKPLALALLAALGLAGLGLNLAATVFDVGDRGVANDLADVTYQVLIAGAAAATLLRAALVRRHRRAWLAVGVGLVAWALGELGLVGLPDSALVEYEWATHAAFLLFYVGVLTGTRLLTGYRGADRLLSYGFFVGLLGVVTLWAGVFFGPGQGDSFVTAADFAYPLLDLVVVAVVVGIWAMHGWRRDPALMLLAGAFMMIAIADAVYAVRVLENTIPEYWTFYDSLWPIGAVLIAAAAWCDGDRGRPIEYSSEWLSLSIALAAGTLAVAVLVWDHFERTGDAAVVIAALTLGAVFIHAVLLQDRWSRARWHGAHASNLSGQALATIAVMQSGRGSESLERRAELAEAVGVELGFDAERIEALHGAARLSKIGRLAGESSGGRELVEGESDALRAAELLKAIGLDAQASHIRDQEQRWDERTKSGAKPGRLSLESSILSIINALDCLIAASPDGEGLTLEVATARIAAQRGTRFDPRVVDALERALARMR